MFLSVQRVKFSLNICLQETLGGPNCLGTIINCSHSGAPGRKSFFKTPCQRLCEEELNTKNKKLGAHTPPSKLYFLRSLTFNRYVYPSLSSILTRPETG